MKNKMQVQDNLTPAQQVAANFVEQFTDEDLNTISNMSLANLKGFIHAVAESNLEYAIHILPGRPDRPKKPTF